MGAGKWYIRDKAKIECLFLQHTTCSQQRLFVLIGIVICDVACYINAASYKPCRLAVLIKD
jgi:hypothetical protein